MPEPLDGDLSIFANGFLGLDLEDGVSPEEASRICKLLNEKIKAITYTDMRDA